jgi:hypothetical protein
MPEFGVMIKRTKEKIDLPKSMNLVAFLLCWICRYSIYSKSKRLTKTYLKIVTALVEGIIVILALKTTHPPMIPCYGDDSTYIVSSFITNYISFTIWYNCNQCYYWY